MEIQKVEPKLTVRLAIVHPLVLGCLLCFVGNLAQAQTDKLNLRTFEPSMDSRGANQLDRSSSLETGQFNFGLYLSHALSPLRKKEGTTDTPIVRHYSMGQLLLAVGFGGRVTLGVQAPVVLTRGTIGNMPDDDVDTADALGDLRASIKVTILDSAQFPVGVALMASTYFPTGSAEAFASDGGTLIQPKLVLDATFLGRFSTIMNVGYTNRPTFILTSEASQSTSDIAVANTFDLGFAFVFAAIRDRFHVTLENLTTVPTQSVAGTQLSNTLLLGGKLFLLQRSFFTFGGGRELTNALTTAPWVGYVGIVFEPQEDDYDGDGIADDSDRCVSEPEDKDDFEDTDGCPELDNDGDKILDYVDACPNQAEDLNDFEDTDGCPDANRDRDKDGFVDRQDQCPDAPEDRDGYRDADGCPEPDNDMDGIDDVDDQCPMKPEDIDGYKDEDGCPDTDNDKDGIPDVRDRCPDQPENVDGIEDEDGCPEERVLVTREKIEFDGKVYFETDRDEVKPASFDLLNEIAEVMNKHPELLKIEVQGHSDSRGESEYNRDLSDRRAAAVRSYLISRGVGGDRLMSRGYGESNPVINEENEAAWSQNRRVEFVIIERAGINLEGKN